MIGTQSCINQYNNSVIYLWTHCNRKNFFRHSLTDKLTYILTLPTLRISRQQDPVSCNASIGQSDLLRLLVAILMFYNAANLWRHCLAEDCVAGVRGGRWWPARLATVRPASP